MSMANVTANTIAMPAKIELSVIIPVSERYDDIADLYRLYKAGIDKASDRHEIIFVLDGNLPDVSQQLHNLCRQGEPLRIIQLSRWYGESAALSAGFRHSVGAKILVLPSYHQVDAEDIPRMVKSLDDNRQDMVLGRRWPRRMNVVKRFQSHSFHYVVDKLAGGGFHDLGCSARAFRRQVMEEIPLYGEQHRFLPLLAHKRGFKVRELDVSQSRLDNTRSVYRLGIYFRRLLDLISVVFQVQFTKKPLRFFGLLGSTTFGVGMVWALWLVVERLVWSIPLSNRPIILVPALLITLGVQLFSTGLIGELIIFTHAKDIKEYAIEEIVN